MAEKDSPEESPPPRSSSISFSDHSPPSLPFHGFGPETVIPERLVIETAGEGDEEKVVHVYKKKRTGRPRGRDSTPIVSTKIILEGTRSGRTAPASAVLSTPAIMSSKSPTVSKQCSGSGSSTRLKVFLLDRPVSNLGFIILPETKDVLSFSCLISLTATQM